MEAIQGILEFIDQIFVKLSFWFSAQLANFLPDWGVTFIMMFATVLVLIVFGLASIIWINVFERKIIGRIQDRYGPNRFGPWGLLQCVADMIKLLTKEDVTPTKADRLIFNLAAVAPVIPTFMILAVLPFGRGMVAADLSIGYLYIVAVGCLGTIAIFMAGWSSRNKYALLGGMRTVAQMISYEIPMVLSVVGVLLLVGSLSMVSIVEAQGQWRLPFVVLQPLAFVLYFTAAVAEVNRSPFDLPEGESEIVAGYHTEYSGIKFAMFLLAEYINAFSICAIATTVFLGGWQGPILPSWAWFFIKTYFLYFVLIWMRGTLPRLRVDQLMNFSWKTLVPLALANLMLTALVAKLVPQYSHVGAIAFLVMNVVVIVCIALVKYPRWRRDRREVVLVPRTATPQVDSS
ncbi:MAG: NADH-quinone oxidoreductase subunit H [Chloroflexi bacterium B3_Chlor]|nr:MAG: NADH-quinone oxidoreductase subunit H [Chloroflexi bacterium B3_Chlor]